MASARARAIAYGCPSALCCGCAGSSRLLAVADWLFFCASCAGAVSYAPGYDYDCDCDYGCDCDLGYVCAKICCGGGHGGVCGGAFVCADSYSYFCCDCDCGFCLVICGI